MTNGLLFVLPLYQKNNTISDIFIAKHKKNVYY